MENPKSTYKKPVKKMTRARSEASEMAVIHDWRDAMAITHPEVGLLYHISNETSWRGPKKQCILSGVPDLVLPVPRMGYGALYIELKTAIGELQPHQAVILERLNLAGNLAMCCHGSKEAIMAIKAYMSIE